MKILMTGGCGFIGSHIVEAYLEAGFEVAVVDKQKLQVPSSQFQVKCYQLDINDPQMESVFKEFEPDVVNHHAALINVADSMKHPTAHADNNVLGTIKLLQLSKEYEVKQFMFASSVAVYGDTDKLPIKEDDSVDPKSFYGVDKLMAEKYITLYQQDFVTTIFRYANVYGPRQDSGAEGGVVAIFAQTFGRLPAVGGAPSIYGNGKQTRDFIFVKDVASANVLATQKKLAGLYHVSTGTEVSINQLFDTMKTISGSDIEPVYKDARVGDITKSVLDNKKMVGCGWKAEYGLQEGLRETIAFFNCSN